MTSRTKKMMTFLSIFSFILFASHFYMFERITYYFQLNGAQSLMVAMIFFGFAFLTLISIPLSRALPRNVSAVFSWIIYPWMGFALLMFVSILATDVVWLLMPTHYLPESYAFLRHLMGYIALSVTALLGVFSLWNALRSVKIKPVAVTLKRLPPSLNGFRIVQITDLHIGPLIGGKWLRQVVNKVNHLQADLVVITGDLVDGSVEELQQHVAPLADLKAKHGTYFVTGNHEYYSGVEQWCAHLARLGISVLRNDRVSIPSDAAKEASFDLAGVDDWAAHQFRGNGADLCKALEGHDAAKTLILLAHQPAAVEEASQYGVDLQISGHTHAGQIWPFTYLVPIQQPYIHGLHRHKNTETQIYISAGTGFWGPPMRLGTSAEITEITLRCSA